MVQIRNILIGFLMLIATSCDGLLGVDNNVGKPIKFGIAQHPTTRTAYSKDYDGRLEWVDGDKVAIYMTYDGSQVFENADYSVNLDYNDERLSYGKLLPLGESLKWHGYFKDGRAWEYNHTFYSSYPPSAFDGNGFDFYLKADQTNISMDYAYMAASEKDINSNGGYVELHYYPMITTLCVTVENNANLQIGNVLELSSNSRAIAGYYHAYIDEYGKWSVDGGEIKTVSSTFNVGDTVKFFIIPREYSENELSFKLGNDTKPIPEVLHAGYKYNVKITTEVEIEPGFSSFVNGVILAEAHKRRDSGQWEYGWYLDGDGDFAYNGQKVPSEKIWEIINSLVDLDVEDTWQITEATAEDFNIFPNIKTVKINATNLTYCEIGNPNITEISIFTQPHCTIDIHDCESLTKLELKSQNGIEDVTIRNNDLLEFFTIDYPHTELTVKCIDCEKLKGFSVKQNYGIKYHVEYSGCPKWEGFTMPDNSTEF